MYSNYNGFFFSLRKRTPHFVTSPQLVLSMRLVTVHVDPPRNRNLNPQLRAPVLKERRGFKKLENNATIYYIAVMNFPNFTVPDNQAWTPLGRPIATAGSRNLEHYVTVTNVTLQWSQRDGSRLMAKSGKP
jgi:hypothetical protein